MSRLLYHLSYAAACEKTACNVAMRGGHVKLGGRASLTGRRQSPYNPPRMTHECALEARSYECDSYGHVNNAVYLNYLEYARHDFMRQAGIRYEDLRARGYGLVVTRVRIDYKAPVRCEDALRVLTAPLAKGRVSCTFSQRIYRGEVLVAEAEVTWACIGPAGRPVRLPAELDIRELEP